MHRVGPGLLVFYSHILGEMSPQIVTEGRFLSPKKLSQKFIFIL